MEKRKPIANVLNKLEMLYNRGFVFAISNIMPKFSKYKLYFLGAQVAI